VPAQTLETEAFVLLKRLPADSFQSFTVFSPTHGLLVVLQRIRKPRAGGKSGGASVPLDLFDEFWLQLESSNQGHTWFTRETRLLARPADIGRSYEALRHASAFAALIARNPVHEDSREAVSRLLREALAAFAAGTRPDIVHLKSVYRFARHEGYPLKEQWFPTLPASDRGEAATLLNQPLAAQTATPEAVARLQRRLDDYLRAHTEFLLD
jgi:hypothetical protein